MEYDKHFKTRIDESFDTDFRLGLPLRGGMPIFNSKGGIQFTTSEASEKSMIRKEADSIQYMDKYGQVRGEMDIENMLYVISNGDGTPYIKIVNKKLKGKELKKKKYMVFDSFSKAKLSIKLSGSEDPMIIVGYKPNKQRIKKLGRPAKVYTITDGFENIEGTVQDLAYEFNVPLHKAKNINQLLSYLGLAYRLVNESHMINESYTGITRTRINS
jgi:hypothetical protein